MSMNVYEEFQWRGIVYDATEGVPEVLARETVTAYIGFDPTASSLHVGSLLPLMALGAAAALRSRADRDCGGGTGHDRRSERQDAGAHAAVARGDRARTSTGIRPQLARFLDFDASTERRRGS